MSIQDVEFTLKPDPDSGRNLTAYASGNNSKTLQFAGLHIYIAVPDHVGLKWEAVKGMSQICTRA